MKKKTNKFIIPIIAALVAYLILDYVNLPSLIGLAPNNINLDMFGILLNTAIVLILYVISFYYIENKQNEKDANSRDIVDVLLKKTYDECLSNLNLLNNREMIGKYIIPKIDGNRPDSENKVINKLQTLPFSSFDAVIDLATNGYVEKVRLNDYLDIKKEYQYLISVKITFFDLINPETVDQKAMYNDIHNRDSALKSKLNKLLNSLDYNYYVGLYKVSDLQ
jgi:hypothetical protein